MSNVEGCLTLLVAFLKEACCSWSKALKFKLYYSNSRVCVSPSLYLHSGVSEYAVPVTVLPKRVSLITSFKRLSPQIASLVALASYAGLDRSWCLNFAMKTNLFSSQVYIRIVGCFVSRVILVWAYFLIFFMSCLAVTWWAFCFEGA